MPDSRPLDARYLYVLKDATGVYYVTGEPALGDIERVKAGGLEIIRLSDLRHFGADGTWHPPQVSGLTSIYGFPGPPLNLPLDLLRGSVVAKNSSGMRLTARIELPSTRAEMTRGAVQGITDSYQ